MSALPSSASSAAQVFSGTGLSPATHQKCFPREPRRLEDGGGEPLIGGVADQPAREPRHYGL